MVPGSAAAQTVPVKAPPSEAVFRASEITESDHQRARQSKRGENSKYHVTAEQSLFVSLIHLGKHVLDTKFQFLNNYLLITESAAVSAIPHEMPVRCKK